MPGAADTALHVVDDQQHAMAVTQPPYPLQVLARHRHDAALALDRLQQYGCGVWAHRGGQRIDISRRNLDKSRRQWTESVLLVRLTISSAGSGSSAISLPPNRSADTWSCWRPSLVTRHSAFAHEHRGNAIK